MHSKPSVKCPANIVGTPLQFVKLKRGGTGQMSGSGRSGWKTRPAAMLAHSLSEMARTYRGRMGTKQTTASKVEAIKQKQHGVETKL